MKLEQGINTKTNQPIAYIPGDRETMAIKDRLGSRGLGFRWYGQRKMWWMPANRVNLPLLSALQGLNVDVSEFSGGQETPTIQRQPTPPEPEIQKEPEVPEVTNKTDYDEYIPGRYERALKPRYLGFPPKSGIYETETELEANGNQYPIKVVVDRWYAYTKGTGGRKTGRRKIPMYRYRAFYNNEPIGSLPENAPGEWNTYSEDALVLKAPEKIQERLSLGDESKIHQGLMARLQLAQRSDDLLQLFEQISDLRYGKESESPLARNIKIDEPGYEGEFPISFTTIDGKTLYGNPSIKHEFAPRSSTIVYIHIPNTVHTIDDLNRFLDQEINENYEDISKQYLKYLKSFPYSQEEAEKSKGQMSEIMDMVATGRADPEYLKNELVSRGYIRPSKKVKKEERVPGFVPSGQIKWVIDSKKIVNDAYRTDNSPDSFYALIAYCLHRKARRIESWSEMMLTDGIRRWSNLAETYGYDLEFKDFSNYLDRAVAGLYRAIYNQTPPKSMGEQWSEFYYGPSATSPTQTEYALDNFVTFVSELGYDAEKARSNPKDTYRQLATQWHPDVNQDPKAEKIFVELSQYWAALPQEYKIASNWYKKIIF